MDRIKRLVELLNKYRYEYYTLGNSTISDNTYDKLFDELKELEEKYKLILSNSPTQTVGYKILDKLNKSIHKYPMLSLDKIKMKDINKLVEWIGNKKVVVMAKEDGLTVQLTYSSTGELVKGETRGNGEVGEDISHNIVCFSNIPLKINVDKETVITGEAIIDYNTFYEINKGLDKNKKYKNPRNLVSGTVRQLDNKICKDRDPKFIAYINESSDLNSKEDQLEELAALGFDVVPYKIIKGKVSVEELKHTVEILECGIEQIQHPIDGLVITYDDTEYGKSLGNTSHHPLHSIALKFQEDSEITILTNIEWQVGRTGVITPVAIFEPVELCGTTVGKASVHNISILRELQLGYGDEISVIKANEIIPQIQDNLTKSNTIETPDNCPICGGVTKIVKSENAEFLHCTNDNCTAKRVQKVSHYCSKNAMNIVGLSEATIEKFMKAGMLNDVLDLYYLDRFKNNIKTMEGFGLKSYNNLIKSIEASKKCRLSNFIFALGIPQVGLSTAKDLANRFNSIDKLLNCDKRSLLSIDGIGEVVMKEIYKFFNNDYNKEFIQELTKHLEFMSDSKVENTIADNILKGKTVYPTGKFSINKNELKSEIEGLGATISSGYKKSLDYLIVGGDVSKSGKVDKAIKDNVKLMTENELMEMLSEVSYE